MTELTVALIEPSEEKFIFLYKRKGICCAILFIDNDVGLRPKCFISLEILILDPFDAISASLDLFSNFSEDIAKSIEALELSFNLDRSPVGFCLPSNIVSVNELSLLGCEHL